MSQNQAKGEVDRDSGFPLHLPSHHLSPVLLEHQGFGTAKSGLSTVQRDVGLATPP